MAGFVTGAERRVHFLSKLALPNVIILNAVKERELGLLQVMIRYCLLLFGGSCEAALAARGPRDRDGQPDFLQAPWGPGGVQSVSSPLANRSGV